MKKNVKKLRKHCKYLALQVERLELEDRVKELYQPKQPIGFHNTKVSNV